MKAALMSLGSKSSLMTAEAMKKCFDTVDAIDLKNVEVSLGEIDLVAKKGHNIDLYEVKCSYRILKAKKQLKRMKRLMNLDKSRAYFYCGSSECLIDV